MRNFITSITSVAVCALFLSLHALARKTKVSDSEMNNKLM